MSDELAHLQEQSFSRGNKAVRSSLTPERRMTGAQIARFLDDHRYAVAASTRPTGRPHAAMTSYFRLGTAFWLPTMDGTARTRNVRAQPWLSLIVTEGEGDRHIAVTVEGAAEVVTLDAAPDELNRLTDSPWIACWLKLTPARLFSYAGSEAPL